jgi:choline-sulfatase
MEPVTRRSLFASAATGPFILSAAQRKRNLLFIMSDQHQRDASGCYGNQEVRTPSIDQIAAAGVRFDRAYCPAPVCVPARGSIVTGVYAHSHGAKILQDPLPASARTIAHYFRERGYVTGAIGKMHFVDETQRHGFDHRLHLDDFLSTLTREEKDLIRKDQGGPEGVQGRPSALPARLFQDTYYAEQTVKFLRENRHRPFCLWSSFFMPHTPLVPAAEYYSLYAESALTLPKRGEKELEEGFAGNLIRAKERGWYQQTDEQLRQSLCGYYGNVTQTDRCVGRVYDALRELGLDRNTVVVYTSDHGEMAGAHRMWTKHNMYEQSVAVPLIVAGADGVKKGSVSSQLVEQIDLFPTLAELCGHNAPRTLPGRSFARIFDGRRHAGREFVYSEYYFCRSVFTRDDRYVGKPPLLMVRTDRWKLNYLSWDRSELYDLARDPGEFHNAIDDTGNAGIVKELTAVAERVFRS